MAEDPLPRSPDYPDPDAVEHQAIGYVHDFAQDRDCEETNKNHWEEIPLALPCDVVKKPPHKQRWGHAYRREEDC